MFEGNQLGIETGYFYILPSTVGKSEGKKNAGPNDKM